MDYLDKLDKTFIFFYKYLPIFHEDSSTYQTNSHQQEYAENNFQIEKKPFSPIFATLHHTKMLRQFLLIFCDFLVPILTGANQRKWHFIFFLHEGHSAMVQKKLPNRAMPFWNLHKKFQLSTTNVH